jgi:hypothetical protein
MVGLGEEIIDRMPGAFEPDKFEGRYENAMIELIRSKQEGLPAPKASARPANVVNLRRIEFDAGSWHALHRLSLDSMKSLQDLADEASATCYRNIAGQQR